MPATRPVRLALLTAALLTGCPNGVAPIAPGPADGGAGLTDGGDGGVDAGPQGLVWPEPAHSVEGASWPQLALSPDGHVTLAYAQDGKVFVHRDPPAGAPVEVGDGFPTTPPHELRLLSSPTEDRALLAWTYGRGVSLTGGVADGPRFRFVDGELYTLGGGWLDGEPLLLARTGERLLAVSVPTATPEVLPLPAPRDEDALAVDGRNTALCDESETLLDLGDGTGLMFERWTDNPPDDTTVRDLAVWRIVRKSVLATGPRAHYYRTLRTGTVRLPGSPASWIRAFDLGEGRYALAWAASSGHLVFDVFVAGFELDPDEGPVLTTEPLNVSMTTGMTDNSDHPIVLPTGDGRAWMAWRETAYGPRVALLSEDLRILALGMPDRELGCDLSSSLGAVVDAEGTLHLAGGFMEEVDGYGYQWVRYFRIALP